MPITNATLVMVATKAILATQHFPATNEKWKEFGKYAHTWGKWKELYKKAEKKARVEHQAAGGCDHFGGDVLGVGTGGAAASGGCGTPVIIDELEGFLTAWPRLQPWGKQFWMNWSKPIPP